ncbi:MAG: hypothetical protein R2882_00180 [Gemmatimonadales bacterium]
MRQMAMVVAGLASTALVATTAVAQPNPFKVPKNTLKAQVTYALSGDQTGTAETAIDGDRFASRSTSTIKMMGKETKSSTLTLMTADSMYSVDLEKKEGYTSPNLLPLYAKAYDGLDGAGKKRFHSNVKEMGAMVSRAFDLNSMSAAGEKKGELTVAGEVCENRAFGSFEVCTMKKGPRIALKTTGDLICYRFEQTATEVHLAAPPAAAFEPPTGIKYRSMFNGQDPDSMAQAFVGYLASEQLADSLAAAQAELEKAKAEAAAKGEPTEMTQEQKDQMREACEMLKNFDMGAVMAGAMKEMQRALAESAKNEAKKAAVGGLKGLIKKPKIPMA